MLLHVVTVETIHHLRALALAPHLVALLPRLPLRAVLAGRLRLRLA